MPQSVEGGALFTGFGAGAGGFLGIRFIDGGAVDGAIDGIGAGGAVVTIGLGEAVGGF
jgi:hypothetical protein